MTTPRLLQIKQIATSCSRFLKKRGWIRRNDMARVTLEEHKWLCEHKPNMARYTRCFQYQHNEFVQDVDRPAEARTPIIREVWIGARSQALAANTFDTEVEDGEDLAAGFKKSQGDQEESAEVTEMIMHTYDDPAAFDAYMIRQVDERWQEMLARKPRLRKHKTALIKLIKQQILGELPCDKYGTPHKCMIVDDDTGELRPLRNGDIVTVARGSNDDLDALFLEEADDPREQNDFSAAGADHRYSDRFRANTDMEESFLHDRDHRIPNSAMPEGTRYYPDDMQIRRFAQQRACDLVLRDPSLVSNILALTDEIENNLRRGIADVRFDENGQLAAGYFVSRSEYFSSIEQNHLNRKAPAETRCALTLANGRKVPGFRSAKLAPGQKQPEPVTVDNQPTTPTTHRTYQLTS